MLQKRFIILHISSSFSAILNEEGLMPTDRVAFACLYLPDEKLSDYINHKWQIAKRNGDISAIYLSGASGNEAVELLQQYVDITGDVQTVSWICIHYMPSDLVNAQVDNYDLLQSSQKDLTLKLFN